MFASVPQKLRLSETLKQNLINASLKPKQAQGGAFIGTLEPAHSKPFFGRYGYHIGSPKNYIDNRKETEMPSKSPAQHRLMQAAANNPKLAKQAGVPQKVAKEFVAADKKAGKKK